MRKSDVDDAPKRQPGNALCTTLLCILWVQVVAPGVNRACGIVMLKGCIWIVGGLRVKRRAHTEERGHHDSATEFAVGAEATSRSVATSLLVAAEWLHLHFMSHELEASKQLAASYFLTPPRLSSLPLLLTRSLTRALLTWCSPPCSPPVSLSFL